MNQTFLAVSSAATADPPGVSVCIPTYNGVPHLAECLNSVIAQTYRNFEVIICDDQSSDGTMDLARELAKGDERFRFISNPRRFGLVGNWNNCVKQACGEWIKFVFQDDVIMPSCIETLLGACERERMPFGFCERDFIFENGTSDSMRDWFIEHKQKLQANYRRGPVISAERATRIAANAPSDNLVGEPPVTLIKKSLFDELGGFDEALSQLCDAEFWCRVMINHGAVFVPANLAAFRVHGKATTAQNHAKGKFRMATLDPLILRYKFAFKRHFRPVRDPQVTGKSVLTLRLEVAQMAIGALSQAKNSGDNSGDSLLKDWRQVTSFYPGLRAAACFGRGLQFFRRIKHQVRIRLPLSIQKLLGHEPPVETPKIPPLSLDGRLRSFWSVMVPTYNPRADYLEETLRSILQQDLGPEQMQIEVVDDCSPEVDVKSIVDSIAKGRVTFSNTPKNLGLAGCWNTCIERARGEWVHILHQDDIVMPGFYAALRKGADDERVGAMFCRHAIINPSGHWVWISELYQESAGILDGWQETNAVRNNIQCPAIVVRRSAYEHLGGYLAQLCFTLDWEMWQRIAAHYAFWFEPKILACFRGHSSSTTSRLRMEAADMRDIRKMIEITTAYYPPHLALKLARQARLNAALMAMDHSRDLLIGGHLRAARKQIMEALRLSRSRSVLRQIASFLRLGMTVAGARLKEHFNQKTPKKTI